MSRRAVGLLRACASGWPVAGRACGSGALHGAACADAALQRGPWFSTAAQPPKEPKEPVTPLLTSIQNRMMVRGGPLSVAEYMQEVLTNPRAGFYMQQGEVFGAGGDFVTSPEVSQMFGEMVGIWCLVAWMQLGEPARLRLVELGPGRGTLMADLLRGTAAFPGFSSALEVHLVELSPAMRARQWRALQCAAAPGEAAAAAAGPVPGSSSSSSGARGGGSGAAELGPGEVQPEVAISGITGCRVYWHASLDAVPGGVRDGGGAEAAAPAAGPSEQPPPTLYLAHEFFDALPVHQFVRDPARGWLEKMVDRADHGHGSSQEEGAAGAQPGPGGAAADGLLRPPASQGGAIVGGAGAGPGRPQLLDASGAPLAASPCGDAGAAAASGSPGAAAAAAEGAGDDGGLHLRLVLSPRPTPAAGLLVPRRLRALGQQAAEELSSIEIGAHAMATAEQLALRVARHGGGALIIDYGQDAPYADSLTAIRAHKGVHPLSQPGTADLSAWVDFSALRQAAEESGAGAEVWGPVEQRRLLLELGMQARAQALAEAGSQAQGEALLAGYRRLTEPDAMGATYKALAIMQAGLPPPVGFEGARRSSSGAAAAATEEGSGA